MTDDPIWVFESSKGDGWKVVYLVEDDDGKTWLTLADGLTWRTAVEFAERCRRCG